MTRNASIIEDFRDKARGYTAGETIFMIDGSEEFHDARIKCVSCIERIKGQIGSKVQTYLWGNDNGSVMVTHGLDDVKRLGDLENHMLLPTLDETRMMLEIGVNKTPAHILVAGAGEFWDDDRKLARCFRQLIADPGVQIDVILGSNAGTKLEKLILGLKDEKAIAREGEPLRLTCLKDAADVNTELVDAINARLFYESEAPDRAAAAFLNGTAGKVAPMRRLKLRPLVKD